MQYTPFTTSRVSRPVHISANRADRERDERMADRILAEIEAKHFAENFAFDPPVDCEAFINGDRVTVLATEVSRYRLAPGVVTQVRRDSVFPFVVRFADGCEMPFEAGDLAFRP